MNLSPLIHLFTLFFTSVRPFGEFPKKTLTGELVKTFLFFSLVNLPTLRPTSKDKVYFEGLIKQKSSICMQDERKTSSLLKTVPK